MGNSLDKEIINYSNIQGITYVDKGIPRYFPSHWHNAAEFTIIFKDKCEYKINDKIYSPEKGDILLVWPRELHEIVHMPENGSLFIQFESRIIESNTDLVSVSRFIKACHIISAKKEPELVTKMTEIIYQIKDIYINKPNFSETKSKMLVYELMILIGEHVMRERRGQIGDDVFSDKSWDYIRTACSYISEHSADDISEADVAAYTGLSPYYFSKLFNEYTQTPFPAYLSSIRVQNAINLLANENLSITECAFMSGFQSTTTFNKLFKELTGCTPREFRKMHRHGQ